MPVADFEEKEFEFPLYRELLASEFDLWTPGQVLEGHLGFDAALRVAADYWEIVGRQPAPGVRLARYGLSPILAKPGELPDFSLNLFLQVKRPFEYASPPREVQAHGLKAPCWYFETRHGDPPDEGQQALLERIEEHLKGRAEVAYAGPAFAQKRRLFSLQRDRVLRHHTTFPTPSSLKDHARWLYDAGGADGVAHSEPARVSGEALIERVQRNRPQAGAPFSQRWAEYEGERIEVRSDREAWITKGLQGLSDALDDALGVPDVVGAAIAAEVDRAVRRVAGQRRDCQRLVLRLALITSRLGITWLAIGPRPTGHTA
jgi:hypothetical protein